MTYLTYFAGEEVNWVQCDHCEEWYHLLCVGLGTDEVKEDEDYKCFKCSDNNSTTIIPSMSDIIIKQESQNDLICHESMPEEISSSVFTQNLNPHKSEVEDNIVEDSEEIVQESEMSCDLNSVAATEGSVPNVLEEFVPQAGDNAITGEEITSVVEENNSVNLDTQDNLMQDESSMDSQDDSQNLETSEDIVEESQTVVEAVNTPMVVSHVMPDIEESSCSQDAPSISSVENNTDETS